MPLLLGESGDKLSKRDGSTTLASLREAGVDAPTLVGLLAHSLGLVPDPAPRSALEVVDLFEWRRLDTRAVVVASDLNERLRDGREPERALRPVESS